jgi:hypothetical protein
MLVHAVVFDLHTLDWVGLGTLILATATFALAFVSFLAILDGKREISATREQAEIARQALEAGQRPALVPIVDPSRTFEDIGSAFGSRLVPTVRSGGMLLIPVTNVGAGPALSVRVQVKIRDADGDASAAPPVQGEAAATSVAAGESIAVAVSLDTHIADSTGFVLLASYYDLAAKLWTTSVQYSARHMKVRSLRIESPGPTLETLVARIDADAREERV